MHYLSPIRLTNCLYALYIQLVSVNNKDSKTKQSCNVLNYILKMWKQVKIFLPY